MRVHMGHNDKGHPTVRRHVGKERLERFQAACGRPDAHNRDRRFRSRRAGWVATRQRRGALRDRGTRTATPHSALSGLRGLWWALGSSHASLGLCVSQDANCGPPLEVCPISDVWGFRYRRSL
jgi:hypothetical protein